MKHLITSISFHIQQVPRVYENPLKRGLQICIYGTNPPVSLEESDCGLSQNVIIKPGMSIIRGHIPFRAYAVRQDKHTIENASLSGASKSQMHHKNVHFVVPSVLIPGVVCQ